MSFTSESRVRACTLRSRSEAQVILSRYCDTYAWAAGEEAILAAGVTAATFETMISYGYAGSRVMQLRLGGHLCVTSLRRYATFVGDPDRQIQPLIDSPMDALLITCYHNRECAGAMICAAVALHYGANPEVMIEGPLLLLHQCALAGAKDFCALLLDFGAEIDCVSMEEDRTALMHAAAAGLSDIVRLFLERGAASDRSNCAGETAASLALAHGHTDVVEMITDFEKRRK